MNRLSYIGARLIKTVLITIAVVLLSFFLVRLAPGDTVTGPALITEDETTIVIPASRRAIARPDGSIDITEISA